LGKIWNLLFSIVKLTNFANFGGGIRQILNITELRKQKPWMTTFSKNVGPNSTTNFTKGYSDSKPQGGGSTPNQGLARVVSVIKEAHSTLILVNCKHVLPPCPRPLILRMPNPAPPQPYLGL